MRKTILTQLNYDQAEALAEVYARLKEKEAAYLKNEQELKNAQKKIKQKKK